MLVKHFESQEAFYRFLKEKMGVFFREAYDRGFEGVFHVLYLKGVKAEALVPLAKGLACMPFMVTALWPSAVQKLS